MNMDNKYNVESYKKIIVFIVIFVTMHVFNHEF